MQILAVDVGTGTQDILLFDSEKEPENAFKMVMPSPTRLLAQAIGAATRAGEDLLLTGVTMGGGPCSWAAREHLQAGLRLFATPDAARTFDDDLDQVRAWGVTLVGDDEARTLRGVRRLQMRDFDYPALARAFAAFHVDLDAVDVLAVAVFDHGAAPPGVSDRLFRFEYLAERIGAGAGLAGFAFPRERIPAAMTRMQAVAATAPAGRPLIVMDTAPAAILGALEDPHVRARQRAVLVNVGNMHTLAFHLRDGTIAGLFEHHTGKLDRPKLERLLAQLTAAAISHEELFADHGHGALVVDPTPAPLDFVAVTGPRRGLLADSILHPYLAVPYGDMMMAGCWGLVRACAHILPDVAVALEE
ncbi:MAG TPA: pyruvate formate lyase-activating protein [Anaerolineae bacterium]|nr:pyruvate formate lyase-activating protein [Anaerolineae bacterium]